MVNFNLFPQESETRAIQFVATVLGRQPLGLPAGDKATGQQLAEAAKVPSDSELADVLSVYLVVAALDQRQVYPGTVQDPALKEAVKELHSAQFQKRIRLFFGSNSFGAWSGVADASRLKPCQSPYSGAEKIGLLIVTPGCVEFRSGGHWMMFKAAWSPSRYAPRCGS